MPKHPPSVSVALRAVSNDLDAQGGVLADLTGEVAALTDLTIESRDELRAFMRQFRERVIPAIDRLGELDELRARITDLELAAE